ncbi:DMT family transporter [Pontibacillus litoralis]|uniref:Multidrug transporter n=1 Tax=Pontibacillus litoralis JSM 072002 TaxID=1385512 RepID=A0A0A5G7K8_9BACI|nr:multidrug efflux SMR transporter [Pontibacillus litoralis]KGX87168.1 multidrug transporter [Pontibacillus litoralis JSM 072002]
MAWTYVLLAGLVEIIWVFTMKLSEGFTQPIPSAITIVGIIISFYLIAKSMEYLPLGTAYAVFTGIGTIGAVGIEFIMEPAQMSLTKLLFLTLLIIGIVGLKFSNDSTVENTEEVAH